MVIEPAAVFAGLGAALMTAYGIELGIAFLIRGERESTAVLRD